VELTSGVHRVEVKLGVRVLYLYLFIGDTTVLLDTGTARTPREELQAHMEELGMKLQDISLAINTHCDADHFGGNALLKTLSPRTLLVAHELDMPQIEDPEVTMRERYTQFEADHGIVLPDHVKEELRAMMGQGMRLDVLLRGDEEIRVDDSRRLRVLHTPGHSRGHVALYDSRERALYIGDAVLWRYIPDKAGKPALAPSYLYPEEYLATIRLLMAKNPRYIHTSHYRTFEGDEAIRFLQESLEFAEGLEQAISRILGTAREPLTLREIIQAVFEEYRLWPEEAKWDLAYPVSGHLGLLQSRGLIRAVRKNGLIGWRVP